MAVRDILASLDDTNTWQEELYKHLHQNPELSMQETQTLAEIVKRLESYGYDVIEVGGGCVGVLKNGEGRTVLFRADIDALPVVEITDLPYKSTKTVTDPQGKQVGVMHACGHDMHVACGLGAAQLLAQHRDQWSGTYLALFQPGEETAEGARSMVDGGLTSSIPKPDVALAQHVLAQPEAGHVATQPGPVLSAGDCLRITVFGKGSHGSMPNLGVDPVVLAAAIVTRLQTVVSRVIAPGDFGVVTVGSLQAGTKANIIPDRAVMLVNLRAYDLQVRERIIAAVEQIVEGECAAAGSPQPPQFEYYEQYPLTSNDLATTDTVTQALVEHFGSDRVHALGRIPASEDFSHIPDAFGVPYSFWGFGGFTPDQEALPNHNPGFAPAIQPTLRTGTEAAVTAVMAFLGKE